MSWPWKYGSRQPIPPDDLPDDFEEDGWGDDDEEQWLKPPARKKNS